MRVANAAQASPPRRLLVLVLLIASACLLAPGSAAAAVIDFDDLAAPPPGGQGLTVNTQYAAQGVTFNDLDAFSYPVGFPHSPNVGVEPCFAIELCQAPARADFTAAQNSVRVWVGYNGSLAEPLNVELNAFDASLSLIDTDTAVLPASSGPTPIQTPLVVNPPGVTIRRIEVDTDTGFTGGMAIDDLEFSTTGPPPPCNATSVPIVSLVQPANNLTVQNNSFLLSGFVNTGGAPITGATVVAQSPTPKTAQAYPSLIDADGGQFGPVNFNGLLSGGANDLVVTATNCLGTGTSNPRRVNLSPIPAGAEFKQLGMIEITQTVQGPDNPTPLIASSGTNSKRTFARVYLGLQGGAPSIANVTGRLTAVRPDGSRPGGPLSIDSLNTVTVEAANSRDMIRSSMTKSLNFEMPREWLAAGVLHLELDRLEVEGAQSNLPCIDCDNHFPSGAPATKTFHAVPPVRIWLVRVPYIPSPGAAANVPTQFDISMLASWLRRAYPTAEVRDTQMFMPTQPGPPGFEDEDDDGIDENRDGFLCDDLNSDLSEWVQSMQAQHTNTRYYGVVSDAGGLFMRGCAGIGGRFGSGPAGPRTFGWDNDGTYADWYGGHEIGHMYDRRHPGFCGESDDDDGYPFPNGLIGSIPGDFQGFDVGDSTLGPAQQLYDWRKGWSDVMTYCDSEWVSDYTYRGILRNLCTREQANCPNHAQLDRASGFRGGAAVGALRAKKGGGLRLSINASLKLPTQKLKLSSVAAQRGLTLTRRPKKSSYAIELRGRRGRELAAYPFEPKVLGDLPVGRDEAQIDEVVRFDPQAERVAITRGSRTLGSVPVSGEAPRVKVTAPMGKGKKARKLRKKVRVRWRGSDADRDRLNYSLLYSADGKEYLPVAAGLRKRSYKVDLQTLPGGKKARFRVVANDGVLTGAGNSKGKLKVPVKAPRVSILTPPSGAALVEGEQVQLAASVEDLQDAVFKAKQVVWTSSVQGELGRGATISAALQPGSHAITVSAENSAGKTGKAAVSVEVAAVPPTIDAVLIP